MFFDRSLVGVIWFLLLSLVGDGCRKSQQLTRMQGSSQVEQEASQQTGPATPKIAACELITKEEVAAIQAATMAEAKSSAGRSGSMLASQCYYSSSEPNKSVSLAVLEADSQGSSGSDTRSYWTKNFGRFTAQGADEEQRREKKLNREEGEEEEKQAPPKKVDGVGEEAFWSATRFGGVLYVLEKDVILRISFGGPDPEETKIAKSKALAVKALSRL